MNTLDKSRNLLSFTGIQKIRVVLMREIARALSDTTADKMVLKGGTALLLAYGLPRYSTDLDFDGKERSLDIVKALYTTCSLSIDTVKRITGRDWINGML